jgi:pimeloyl-ACP methyl ester carboxylesterase
VNVAAIMIGALASFALLVVISYIIEALRPAPKRPERLAWAPDIPIQYLDIGGVRVRYLKTGAGPNLVLLHTLRTQLDIFEKVIPELAKRFTVYAYDYPGHGWSDVPKAAYAPEDFYNWTAEFLEALDIRQASVAGISIGGTISLVLAGRGNARVAKVISINPYDYWPAGGIRKSSITARITLTFADVPVLGATMMRLRNRYALNRILEGGVSSPDAMPKELAEELNEVGNRPGHYQGFLSLLAHERLWPEAHKEYSSIKVPVLLVYGEKDWAPQRARAYTRSLIPGVVSETVSDGSHFLSLDRSRELLDLIIRFAGS